MTQLILLEPLAVALRYPGVDHFGRINTKSRKNKEFYKVRTIGLLD